MNQEDPTGTLSLGGVIGSAFTGCSKAVEGALRAAIGITLTLDRVEIEAGEIGLSYAVGADAEAFNAYSDGSGSSFEDFNVFRDLYNGFLGL